MNEELTKQLEYNEAQRQDEIKWLREMLDRLKESKTYVSEKNKHKYYLKQFTNYYDTLIALLKSRLEFKLGYVKDERTEP